MHIMCIIQIDCEYREYRDVVCCCNHERKNKPLIFFILFNYITPYVNYMCKYFRNRKLNKCKKKHIFNICSSQLK